MQYDLAIIVDTGKNIGFGNIVRCINIAKECSKYYKTLFIISTEESKQRLKKEVFDYIYIKNQKDIEKVICQYNIKVTLIDLKDIDRLLIKRIKQYCKVGIIEDLYAQKYEDIDFLLNYNIYADYFEYDKIYSDNVKLLIGEKYAPVEKKSIGQIPQVVIKNRVRNILITTGATDINGLNVKILDAIVHMNYNIKVVVGPYDTMREILCYKEAVYPNIELLYSVQHIYDVLNEIDLVICTAGFSLYELSYAGIPTIIVSHGDKDLVGNYFFEKIGFRYAGNKLTFTSKRLLKEIEEVNENTGIREQIKVQGPLYIDGQGIQRICKKIGDLIRDERKDNMKK